MTLEALLPLTSPHQTHHSQIRLKAYVLTTIAVVISSTTTTAFSPSFIGRHAGPYQTTVGNAYHRDRIVTRGFLDDVGKMFDNFGNGDDKEKKNGSTGGGEWLTPPNSEEEEYPGCTRVFTIPVQSMKVGGLRLWLSLFLISLQNEPTKNTWLAHQPTTTDIDLYYHDKSAALSIRFDEDEGTIVVRRRGSNPSTSYMVRESVILQGVLEELERVAFGNDDEVEDVNRLLRVEAGVLEDALGTLSFS